VAAGSTGVVTGPENIARGAGLSPFVVSFIALSCARAFCPNVRPVPERCDVDDADRRRVGYHMTMRGHEGHEGNRADAVFARCRRRPAPAFSLPKRAAFFGVPNEPQMNAPIVRIAKLHAGAPQGAPARLRMRAPGARARVEAACRSGTHAFDR